MDDEDLLTRLSHEMRTPLSAILGFAQLLDSGTPALTMSQRRSVQRILQAGWYLDKLIDTTRDLALLEAGTLSLSLQPVPLAAVMLDCRSTIEAQAKTRGVRVTFPAFATPLTVAADRGRLQDVLGNLLATAIEYNGVNGAVVVNCESRGSDWIRIGIDAGAGSSAERLTRQVRSFHGLAQSTSAVDGTGLGLLLARRLVESMGGAIGGEDIGSRPIFSFDLRRAGLPHLVADRTA